MQPERVVSTIPWKRKTSTLPLHSFCCRCVLKLKAPPLPVLRSNFGFSSKPLSCGETFFPVEPVCSKNVLAWYLIFYWEPRQGCLPELEIAAFVNSPSTASYLGTVAPYPCTFKLEKRAPPCIINYSNVSDHGRAVHRSWNSRVQDLRDKRKLATRTSI